MIQEISKLSKVWIEPPSTTLLLDSLLAEFSSEEVWYCGVPGAGGDDAIFVLGEKGLKSKLKERFVNARPNLAVLPIELS